MSANMYSLEVSLPDGSCVPASRYMLSKRSGLLEGLLASCTLKRTADDRLRLSLSDVPFPSEEIREAIECLHDMDFVPIGTCRRLVRVFDFLDARLITAAPLADGSPVEDHAFYLGTVAMDRLEHAILDSADIMRFDSDPADFVALVKALLPSIRGGDERAVTLESFARRGLWTRLAHSVRADEEWALIAAAAAIENADQGTYEALRVAFPPAVILGFAPGFAAAADACADDACALTSLSLAVIGSDPPGELSASFTTHHDTFFASFVTATRGARPVRGSLPGGQTMTLGFTEDGGATPAAAFDARSARPALKGDQPPPCFAFDGATMCVLERPYKGTLPTHGRQAMLIVITEAM